MKPDIEAIRARVECPVRTESRNGLIQDRRALLAYVDALVAAAGKVTCINCGGDGDISLFPDVEEIPCPDCSDLRALLEKGR